MRPVFAQCVVIAAGSYQIGSDAHYAEERPARRLALDAFAIEAAPVTNAAFAALPAGTVDTLLKPENKAQLQSVLTYHVVPGKLMAKDVLGAIKAGGGKAVVTTVQGGKLTASVMGNKVMLTDAKGRMSHVSTADLDTTNGVIHVVDNVLLP